MKRVGQPYYHLVQHDNQTLETVGLYSKNGIGRLLYLTEQIRYVDNDKTRELISQEFKFLSELLNKEGNSVGFGTGLGGLGWFLNNQISNNRIDVKVIELLSQIDELNYKDCLKNTSLGNYDFIYGALGNVLYLICRIKNDSVRLKIEEILKSNFLNGLLKYFDINQNKKIDLGLAHGLSGAILLLSRIKFLGIKNQKLDETLERLIDILVSTENPSEQISRFPAFYYKNAEPESSRLAWCYGDLGIGFALNYAGKISMCNSIENFGLNVMLNTITRKSENQTQVNDYCICHGSSGLALMYNRIFKNTGIEDFRNSSLYWIGITNSYLNKSEKLKKKIKNQTRDNGFLEGTSGVLLTINALMNHESYDWDESLLLWQ